MESAKPDDLLETHSDPFKSRCALLVSLLAMVLALASLGGSNASKEATMHNILASNAYAFYQAKNIRLNDLNLAAQTLEGIANTAGPLANESAKQQLRQQAEAMRAKALSYDSEPSSGEGKKELLAKAKESEKIRDEAMQKGPYFDFAGLLLQLSIILISVVLITERRTLYLSGVSAAVLGTFLSLDGFYLFLKIPFLG